MYEKSAEKGQHFQINLDLLENEIKLANITPEDDILEIGGGGGNLSRLLVKTNAKTVTIIEIDEKYAKILMDIVRGKPNAFVIIGDALEETKKLILIK